MKAFLIQGEDEPVVIVAKNMGYAIQKWRHWMVDQSDGAVSLLSQADAYPDGIQEIADEVIT